MGAKNLLSIVGISLVAVILLCFFAFIYPWFALWFGLATMPNPPKPEIVYGEFSFRLQYEIKGEKHTLNDTIICNFDGYNIDEGRGKTRKWKYCYKNEQNNEIFVFNAKNPKFPKIVLKNIEQYKIVLGVANAEYFLAEPEYKGTTELPSIQIYDTSTGYYKDPKQSEEFLKDYGFKIIDWYCDPPIKNTFK